MKINPFKKDENISDAAYRKGKEETGIKLKAEFDELKEEILNSHAEEINKKDMEIMTLDTQLKNWKADYLLSQQKLKEAKAIKAENKRERYRIDKFKEEMERKIKELQIEEASKYQDLLEMIGVKQLEG